MNNDPDGWTEQDRARLHTQVARATLEVPLARGPGHIIGQPWSAVVDQLHLAEFELRLAAGFLHRNGATGYAEIFIGTAAEIEELVNGPPAPKAWLRLALGSHLQWLRGWRAAWSPKRHQSFRPSPRPIKDGAPGWT